MGMLATLRLAVAGVLSNKFRSFLTLLGIIIGVGAVILMVSLGSGTQEVVHGQFSSLQTRQIYISTNYNLPYQQRGRLSIDDEEYLKGATIGVEKAVPFYRLYYNVKFNSKEIQQSVYGVKPASLKLTNLKLEYGRYINNTDLLNKERVAVVGEKLLQKYSKKSDYSSLIGKQIEVDGNKLIIIGILGESDSTLAISNDSLIMPLSTARDLWRRRTEDVDFYLISYGEQSSETDIMSQIKYLLNHKYGKTANGESRFRYEGLAGRTQVLGNIVKVFTYVLGGIAAISLLVGGIGVMNIMLVTVKERTREIGIRLAIGATREDIQKQFLYESVILTLVGGIAGMIVGSGLSIVANIVISKFFKWWQGAVPIWIIVISFAVTVGIGIIFGFYPAYKASKLDPIEALRYE